MICKNIFRCAIFPVLLCIRVSNAAAAVPATDTALNARLASISRQMAVERNQYFILVEALKDGFITPGANYDFTYYATGRIDINGKELAAPYEGRYDRLMKDFLSKDSAKSTSTFVSMRGGGFSLGSVLNEKSEFRTGKRAASSSNHTASTASPKPHTFPTKVLLKEMAGDGLIDTTKRVFIDYSSKGFFLDGKRLPPPYQEKYTKRFVELNDNIAYPPGTSTDITVIPDAPKKEAPVQN